MCIRDRAIEAGQLNQNDRLALLGIGSGINCLVMGVEWQKGLCVGNEIDTFEKVTA